MLQYWSGKAYLVEKNLQAINIGGSYLPRRCPRRRSLETSRLIMMMTMRMIMIINNQDEQDDVDGNDHDDVYDNANSFWAEQANSIGGNEKLEHLL